MRLDAPIFDQKHFDVLSIEDRGDVAMVEWPGLSVRPCDGWLMRCLIVFFRLLDFVAILEVHWDS